MNALDGLLRDALVTTATISLPVLGVAALVGAVVAIVQAATQVQEQTLTLLPKVIAIGATVALFGVFAMHLLAGLFAAAIAAVPALTNGS